MPVNIQLKSALKSLPQSPGVYLFKDKKGKVLYVGKAGNLKNRVKSYFQSSYAPANPVKAHLIKQIAKIETRPTDGEIAALVLESQLIKTLKPPYNKLMRDDKQYFFVQVTNETFPRIFLTHQPLRSSLVDKASGITKGERAPTADKANRKKPDAKPTVRNSTYIGPFTSGRALKTTLKTLRQIFPYCTCKNPHRRKCLNAHLGLCPGYCCIQDHPATLSRPQTQKTASPLSQEAIKQYQANIKNIVGILRGRPKKILQNLKQDLKTASQNQAYEQAASLRDKIKALEKILAHKQVLRPDFPELSATSIATQAIEQELAKLLGITELELNRLEAYDISNLQGQQATGSMIVFEKTEQGFKPAKAEYRRFKIQAKAEPNDPLMMGEVLKRRLKHREWPLPNLILVDGGRSQLQAALEALSESEIKNKALRTACNSKRIHNASSVGRNSPLAIVALAKQQELLYTKNTSPLALNTFSENLANLLRALRDEAHRFAHRYHQNRRQQALTPRFND